MEDQRKREIFQQFWSTGTYAEQSNILARYMRKEEKITRENADEPRTYHFYLPNINGVQQQVCKTTFMTVFGVTLKRIEVLQQKLNTASLSLEDGRGRHENRPSKLGANVHEDIVSHINSYERCIGHYIRKDGDPLREYLSKDLNVSLMFQDFTAAYGEESLSWEWIYSSTFKSMKLRFGVPLTDTCTICDRYNVRITALDENNVDNQPLLENLWTECTEHQLKSENGYEELRDDVARSKREANYKVVSIDMQGLLLCPRLTNSDYYYQNKYHCFNVGIHNGRTDTTTMCFWHQREANRRSGEIASCLLKFCQDNFDILDNEQQRTLVVYSDRCRGQNNNYMMICLYRLLIARNYFSEINQKFMCTGHSFLPCDRQFALVEKKQKNAFIYEPKDWIKVIEDANQPNPFKVQRMTQNLFFDFKRLSLQVRRPASLKVSESIWFQMSRNFPLEIKSKETLKDSDWESHIMRTDYQFILNLPLQLLYQNPIQLPVNLVTDLKKMIEFLPDESKTFWNFLNEM